ncbi:hypothetical protein CYMTET_36887 [Cymbomonas tetramitiformis]|uniref:Uncharacterized protein n=1 Tax=Cymbomonas tetramitiformis TaxID=36881 RepID=A0AAE0CGU4_9CHLO|nr:hypothetical protein CYMTET_36887 [Cymbomonas tetramitiformis]
MTTPSGVPTCTYVDKQEFKKSFKIIYLRNDRILKVRFKTRRWTRNICEEPRLNTRGDARTFTVTTSVNVEWKICGYGANDSLRRVRDIVLACAAVPPWISCRLNRAQKREWQNYFRFPGAQYSEEENMNAEDYFGRHEHRVHLLLNTNEAGQVEGVSI